MPDLNKMIRQMWGVKIFSIFDLWSRYWQVPLDENARKYTVFRTRRGLFQFRVLPFGLKNSPMTFVRLMNEVMRCYQGFRTSLPRRYCSIFKERVRTGVPGEPGGPLRQSSRAFQEIRTNLQHKKM